MRLTVNGAEREVTATTIAELVGELGLDTRKVAVERNLEIVPRSSFGATEVADGDQFEIVRFIGGG